MFGRNLWSAWCAAGLAICGCDSGGSGGTGGETRLVVTADWLNQSLTLLDYDELLDGERDGPAAAVEPMRWTDWEPVRVGAAGALTAGSRLACTGSLMSLLPWASGPTAILFT